MSKIVSIAHERNKRKDMSEDTRIKELERKIAYLVEALEEMKAEVEAVDARSQKTAGRLLVLARKLHLPT